MRSPQEPLVQLLHDARLANTRFAREQHRLTFTGYDPFETVDEQRDFVLPPNKSGQANSSCFEAAFDRPLGEHLPGADRLVDALDLPWSEIVQNERLADELPSQISNDHLIRSGQRF